MSVRRKLLIVVLATSVAFSAATYLVQHLTVLPEFAEAELNEARADVSRGLYSLHRGADFLASSAADYGAWDDTYEFVKDANEKYKEDNLIPETFKNLHLNLLAIIRSDGTVVWGELRQENGGDLMDATRLLALLARTDSPLLAHATPESRVSGVLITPAGPMLVGSAAITTSNRSAAVRGAVIMAHFVDAGAIEDLARRTNAVMHLHALDAIPDDDGVALTRLSDAESVWTDDSHADVLRSYAVIADVFGHPALLLRTDRPRVITQRAAIAARTALATSAIAGLVLLTLLWFALTRMVISPLDRLTRHAVRVGANDDLRARLNLTSGDEIGTLAREFDRMVDRLAQSRAQTIDIAHNAGQARVAAEVLHNVGNVLNSVNVAADAIHEKLRHSEVETVNLAARLLLDHEDSLGSFVTDDERGRQLPAFLARLGTQLAGDQKAMLDEVATLSEAIEHIRGVISEQQQHTRGQTLVEWAQPASIVERALTLSVDSWTRHSIQVRCRNEFEGEAQLDRHRLLQVLVNLLANAKAALKAAGLGERHVDVLIRREHRDGGDWLQIEVQDNGVGIAPENVERIFAMGFSTRAEGQGLGLHSAANLAWEMGGTLVARSDGPGRGATFTLSIPLRSEKVPA